MTVRSARVWHALTAAVAIVALVPQLVLDHREHRVLGVVIAVGAVTAFFLLLFALPRYVDQRARPAPEAWDPYRGGVAQP